MAETISVEVWRGTGQGNGRFQTFQVPARDNQTVLDVVTEIQRRQDPTLTYRFACRVGVCGSCAMMVNGEPRWTCRTHVKKVIGAGAGTKSLVLEPLRNLPVIKDLASDMTPFFDKWHQAGGVFQGTETRDDPPAAISPKDRDRKAVDAAIECINCAVCYAACDVVSWDQSYLGPAALNRAWTLVKDERHVARADTLTRVSEAGGCGSCHSQGACMAACPVGLSPTESIAGLKRTSLAAWLWGEL